MYMYCDYTSSLPTPTTVCPALCPIPLTMECSKLVREMEMEAYM